MGAVCVDGTHRSALIVKRFVPLVLWLVAAATVGCRVATRERPLNASAELPLAACGSSAPDLLFRSSLWLNLSNFLHKEAKARTGISNDATGARETSLTDTAGVRVLTAPERAAWDRAVDYYAGIIRASLGGGDDSLIFQIDDRLAALPDSISPVHSDIDPQLAENLARAAPVYRDVWWPIHDRNNQTWIGVNRELVQRYGGCGFARMEQVFRSASSPAIKVDAGVYSNWFGAYATSSTGPHVVLSSNAVGNQDAYGLETVLHESAHASRMLGRLDSALTASALSQGVEIPSALSHMVLFYTAGETVRAMLPTHVPYAERFGIWSRNARTQRLHDAIRNQWQPYLDGRVSFNAAVDRLVAAAGERSEGRAARR
jgi:hypothetical protein